jgi:hypothetical protein
MLISPVIRSIATIVPVDQDHKLPVFMLLSQEDIAPDIFVGAIAFS